MKVVILAGGWKSAIHSEYEGIPKPMVEIGERPLLWHIMKRYSQYGYKDFIICAGYKSKIIKEYFMNYYVYQSDITVDLQSNDVVIHKKRTEDWNVTVIDTGLNTTISERLLQIQEFVNNESFIIHYGDCLSDINIKELVQYHHANKKIATFTVAKPMGRNKIVLVDDNGRLQQQEDSNAWVNASTIICEPSIYHYLRTDESYLEAELLERLQEQKEVAIYRHSGFFTMLETLRTKQKLEIMWENNQVPWLE